MFQKSAALFSSVKSEQVDSINGIIKGVVILQSGKDKHGDSYDMKSLEQLTELGNAQGQGVKVRNGHPNMCDSQLGTFIGRYKNFAVTQNSDGLSVVTADLHLDKEACKTSPKGDPFDHIILMAQKNADMFGNSICFMSDQPEAVNEKDANGNNTVVYYTRFKSLIASDLVDSPAATTSLFKDDTGFAAKATMFLDENPEIYEVLSNHPKVWDEFQAKYKSYLLKKQKSNTISMTTFKEKVKALLGMVEKDFTATTMDGAVHNFTDSTGTGVPTVGETVTDANGAICASCTLTMADGSVVVTDANGVITSVTEAEAATAPPAKSVDVQLTEMKSAFDAMKKEKEENEAASLKALETLNSKVKELESRLASIKSTGDPKTSGTQITAPKVEASVSSEERKADINKFRQGNKK